MAESRMRRLGRMALLVSELGFGASNVAVAPEGEKALLRAFALGIDFVDGAGLQGQRVHDQRGPQPAPRPGGCAASAKITFCVSSS